MSAPSYLNPLIGVRHHSNQEIDEDDDRHQHVNAKDNFEQIFGPIGLRLRGARNELVHLRLFGRGLAEDGKEQQLERQYGIHADYT